MGITRNEGAAINDRQRVLERHIDEVGDELVALGFTPTRCAIVVMLSEPDENGCDVTSGYGLGEDGDPTELIVDLLDSAARAARRSAP